MDCFSNLEAKDLHELCFRINWRIQKCACSEAPSKGAFTIAPRVSLSMVDKNLLAKVLGDANVVRTGGHNLDFL